MTGITRQGLKTIATEYIPPNSPYLHYFDNLALLNRTNPLFIVGDLNARHRICGHRDCSTIGRNLQTLIDSDKCRYVGPGFPSLLRHDCATSADLVLTNNRVFHNIDLRPGPMTPSDRISILTTIMCNPIPIKIPRLQFSKADWTGYSNSMTNIEMPKDLHPTPEQRDNHLEKWTSIVQPSTESYVPKIKYRIIPGIKPSDDIKSIQVRYDAANLEMTWNRPSLHISRLINYLRKDN